MNKAAVIFDMDGLLFDTERLYLDMSAISQKQFGVEIPLELHLQTIGLRLADSTNLYHSKYGPDFPVDAFMRRTKEMVYAHIDRNGIPIKPGAEELLQELHGTDISVVLASSSPKWMIEKNLSLSSLDFYFHLIVSGDEVPSGKPAPDIFLRAAELAGVEPRSCFVIEDSNNGIRAAFAAGMIPIMVPDVKPPDPEVKEMIFRECRDLFEVKNILKERIL